MSFKEYAALMYSLELAKRDEFPEQAIKLWWNIVKAQNWSKEELQERVEKCLVSKTYGKFKIEELFEVEELYTQEQVNEIRRNMEVEFQKKWDRAIQRGEELKDADIKTMTEEEQRFFDLHAAETAKKRAYIERDQFLSDYAYMRQNEELAKIRQRQDRIYNLDTTHKARLIGYLMSEQRLAIPNQLIPKMIPLIHYYFDVITEDDIEASRTDVKHPHNRAETGQG